MQKYVVGEEAVHEALRLQQKADNLTAIRKDYSEVVGCAVAVSKRNWPTFLGGCILALTDVLDGRLAKKAQSIVGVNKPLTNGGSEDPSADKILRSSMTNGVTARASREGDLPSLVFFNIKSWADGFRDSRMEHNRQLATKYTDIGVSALPINRAKTVLELGGVLLHINPASEERSVRHFSLALIGLGTVLGLVGERQYAHQVESRMQELSSQCPDELELVE